MGAVVLSEKVNLEAVKYLITKPKAWWKEILKTDKKRKFEIEYKQTEFRLGGVEKMRLDDNGYLGINQQGPTEALDVVGNIKASGTIEIGKETNGTSHLGRGRIHSQSLGPGSIVSFSHNNTQAGDGLGLVQTEAGETWLNCATGKTLTFRIAGFEKMRVHSDGKVGVMQTSPAEALDVAGNIKASGNVIATNIRNYYQTTNSANSTVADSSDSVNQVTDAGCPSTASVWTRYTSWKISGDDTVNSYTNVFSPQDYGFKALVAGTYKITVHMTFQTFKGSQNVAIRLAKGALVNDVADSNNENPGPLANAPYMNSYQGGGKIHSIGCAQITHIMTLAVDDEVSVHTVQVGYNDPAGNNVHTREGYSQFLAEYLG